MDFSAKYNAYKEKTESYLKEISAFDLNSPCYFDVLRESIRYSLLAGGKRLRPVILLASAEMAGGNADDAMPFAAAMEMIHTASLIHDDLPAMDDDDLRRGRKTNHKVYGEATALLAGDALFVYPFEIMAKAVKGENEARAMEIIASHAGVWGMMGGQQVDLSYEGKPTTEEIIVQLNTLKTGALFKASVCAGLSLGGATKEELEAGYIFGDKLGLAFQLVDDLLDNDPTADTGKTKGSDVASGKSTYLSVYGEEKCRELIHECTLDAEKILYSVFKGKAEFLITLTKQLETRKN